MRCGNLRCRSIQDHWPKTAAERSRFGDDKAGALLEWVRKSIRNLKPTDEGQKWLLGQALDINVSLLRQRWLLIEQAGRSVRGVVLEILVSWIVAIFASFGLNAPRNGTVVAAFLICSMAIGGSIFLILEMDQPLAGVMRISSWPMENVLTHMNW